MSSRWHQSSAGVFVRAPAAVGIDADMLERMARIARDLPGHTVSLDAEDAAELPPESQPMLRIDGVAAEDFLERCYDETA